MWHQLSPSPASFPPELSGQQGEGLPSPSTASPGNGVHGAPQLPPQPADCGALRPQPGHEPGLSTWPSRPTLALTPCLWLPGFPSGPPKETELGEGRHLSLPHPLQPQTWNWHTVGAQGRRPDTEGGRGHGNMTGHPVAWPLAAPSLALQGARETGAPMKQEVTWQEDRRTQRRVTRQEGSPFT